MTGYATTLGSAGHTVGESNMEVKALIGAARAYRGTGIIVPTRNADLFRWCLDHGLRVSVPGTMMSVGFYNEPQGGYLPSSLY